MRARTRLRALVGSLVLAVSVFAGTASAPASTPPNSTLDVPTSGGMTVRDNPPWTGTAAPGVNPTSTCAPASTSPVDEHVVTINVPAGTYDTIIARFKFNITWTPPNPDDTTTSDLILTVVGPDGTVVDSSDGGSPTETVRATNLPAGDYKMLVCGFANETIQEYTGKAEVTTSLRSVDTTLPSAPANGLAFSAGVAADPQRDESEPLVEIDPNGNIVECGPTGSSQGTDYFQVSTDDGNQFHMLGQPPRGQMGGGGGDCAIAFSPTKSGNAYDWAFSGLGPLTGFATAISPNEGHSFATGGFDFTGGVTNRGGVADRQWQTFVSATDVLLIYNQVAPRNTVVLRSTDKGLTFNIAGAVIGARSPLFPGPIRYDHARNLTYFAWDDTGTLGEEDGDFINLSVSRDKGVTWFACRVDFVPGEVPGFVTADHDRDGNIYVAYGDSDAYHTYVKALPQANIANCNKPVADSTTTAPNLTDPGFGPRIQVDRDAIRTTVFPWLTAGGAPGRIAVTFYGTTGDGDPNLGTFKGAWDVYVNMSLNALAADATFSQVKATTHPMHYDSICLQGLGCDLAIPPGDRTMADFFAIDYNPETDRLVVAYNRTNKKPDEELGHVASPMALTQIAGPTLGGGTLPAAPPVVRSLSTDPTGDALSNYSTVAPLVVPSPPATANEPAADFTSVSVGPEIDLLTNAPVAFDGGFTVTMKVANLASAALMETLTRTQAQSLLWFFRFTNGYQDVAASARWNPVEGFTFGYNDYTTGSAPCQTSTGSGDKCVLYPGDQPIEGDVNQATGTIRLSVPRWLLRALSPGADGRPGEGPATVDSLFYDATAFSMGNPASPVQTVQSFLYPFDNTPAMDFRLPKPDDPVPPPVPCKVTGGGTIATAGGDGKFSLNVQPGFPPKGSVAYRDPNDDFRSTSIGSSTCVGTQATITGLGRHNGNDVSFTVKVVDGGESSASDSFTLELPDHTESGNLKKGNIQVHR